MKRKISISLIFCLLSILFDWDSENNWKLALKSVAAEKTDCTVIATVESIGGEPFLSRGWREPNLEMTEGQKLCETDVILMRLNAEVSLFCELINESRTLPSSIDQKLHSVGQRCDYSEKLCDITDCHRGPEDDFEIIYPSNTALLINNPSFRWQPFSNATNYMVVLKNVLVEGAIWRKTVNGTEMSYPADEPPLKKGLYTLTIIPLQADNTPLKINDREVSEETGFVILDREEAQEVRKQVEELELDSSNELGTILALLDLYKENNLRADAIEKLEELIDQGKSSVYLYRELGDLYWIINRVSQAEKAYLDAISLAETDENLHARAFAHSRLGELYQIIKQKDKAAEMLEKAKNLYQEAGNTEGVERIEQWIEKLGG